MLQQVRVPLASSIHPAPRELAVGGQEWCLPIPGGNAPTFHLVDLQGAASRLRGRRQQCFAGTTCQLASAAFLLAQRGSQLRPVRLTVGVHHSRVEARHQALTNDLGERSALQWDDADPAGERELQGWALTVLAQAHVAQLFEKQDSDTRTWVKRVSACTEGLAVAATGTPPTTYVLHIVHQTLDRPQGLREYPRGGLFQRPEEVERTATTVHLPWGSCATAAAAARTTSAASVPAATLRVRCGTARRQLHTRQCQAVPEKQ
mmetsp:Transcript_159684/g.387714  ORF Transcript_159684/g.387714 Transcript_159684/m.387714 type:complete len:262 (-) Transcript_159684:1117-1902(-)